MVTVEKIKKKELNSLSKLYSQLVNEESIMSNMIKAFNSIENNPNYYLMGVKLNQKLIGSAMAIICYDLVRECRPFMVIENVIIDKNYRGNGYGGTLINKIEDIAKKKNCHYIMLLSNKNRAKSHKFYSKHGYNCDNIGFKKYL
ncbi:GNAT family N-acetyltransferase [Caldisalinibacter kiritimatiensis]|uniref:N-acetyltransferase domain-containing protein n=1 Tax=Caldisalinibacter kiritimatiensis TaxID=1304284 RepID=R1AY19_9FIRM|nr:GNAT family N-acetyltransferase [Caldisalinibacter kiritimatiensis]EOD01552.1 hypothetical protein L21TH_0355 [Caldisalinibacter kiritimatiensis]